MRTISYMRLLILQAAVSLMIQMSISTFHAAEAEPFKAAVHTATDLDKSLECSLDILRDQDGGVYALTIKVSNLSDRETQIQVNKELSAAFVLSITDDKGRVLSTPAKKFRTDEALHFLSIPLLPKSTYQWFFPLKDRIKNLADIKSSMSGRIILNVVIDVFCLSKTQGSADVRRNVNFSLHDTNVLYTSNALRGDPWIKYQKSVRSQANPK